MTGALRPGAIVLFGSGETASVGRDALRWLRDSGRALRSVAVVETPAGFELNADAVARRWTDFLARQAEAEGAAIEQLPLRRRGTEWSPERADLARPLLGADLIAVGAGSPTYAARQLRDTVAWRYLAAAHLSGASVLLASASAVAASSFALPVYEIYKAGAELSWADGLGLLEPYGLSLAIVPHWDNTDGRAEVDTSCCFMGEARFAALRALLPAAVTVVGVAEHSALALDPIAGTAAVLGQRDVVILRGTETLHHPSGATLPLASLGPFALPDRSAVPADLVRAIAQARAPKPPEAVRALVEEREAARQAADWSLADRLRDAIAERGWRIEDTTAGPRLVREPSDEAAGRT